jgi:phosphoglycolate phosphatase
MPRLRDDLKGHRVTDTAEISCNICGGTDFREFARRPKAHCAGCGSVERTRGMMHLIDSMGLVQPGFRVLHFAPERGIGERIIKVVGAENYDSYDIAPERYWRGLGVKRFDLTEAHLLPTAHYDLILHSHVLEHIPCYLAPVIWHLQRALTPNGAHLFCIPVFGARHESDFNAISDEDKTRRFGQSDHVRKFGRDDMAMTLGMVLDLNPRTFGIQIDHDLAARHNIKPNEVRNSMFLMRKGDLLLSEAREYGPQVAQSGQEP